MTIEIAGGTVLENPTPEQIKAAVVSLDGKHKYVLRLCHSNGATLQLSRERRPRFFAVLLYERDGVTVSKHSEKPLSQEQAVRAAQAYAEGREAWPLFMKWQQDVEMTPEARREALAEEQARPMWERIGTVALASLAAWSFFLLLEGTDRGFGDMFIVRAVCPTPQEVHRPTGAPERLARELSTREPTRAGGAKKVCHPRCGVPCLS